jgi:hypothetical protein
VSDVVYNPCVEEIGIDPTSIEVASFIGLPLTNAIQIS